VEADRREPSGVVGQQGRFFAVSVVARRSDHGDATVAVKWQEPEVDIATRSPERARTELLRMDGDGAAVLVDWPARLHEGTVGRRLQPDVRHQHLTQRNAHVTRARLPPRQTNQRA